MDPGALKARHRRWLLQEWGEDNPAVAGELIAEGLVDHNRPQGQPTGRLAGEDWMAKMIRTAFPRRHLPGSGQAADSPASARDALSGRLGATGGGELMMTTRMHAHPDRIRNLELADGTFGPDAAGLDRSAKRRRERNPGRGERVVVRARSLPASRLQIGSQLLVRADRGRRMRPADQPQAAVARLCAARQRLITLGARPYPQSRDPSVTPALLAAAFGLRLVHPVHSSTTSMSTNSGGPARMSAIIA